jgi:hypothetical protein
MASNNMVQPQVPCFAGKNYNKWSIQMKAFFGSQDLWDIVESGFDVMDNVEGITQRQQTELKENRKKNNKALFYIYQVVDEGIF